MARTWPDATSVGARGELPVRKGLTVTEDGTVLADVEIRGQLTIDADRVVVRNVRVVSEGYYAILVSGRDVLIEDSTLTGGPESTASLAAAEGGQFVARRLDVSGAEDGVRLADDCVLADSFVHDLSGGDGRHNDGVTADGHSGWSITGNTILNAHDQTAAVWVGDARYGPSSGVLEGNLIGGGGYSVYAGPGGADGGIQVRDNAFSTRFWPSSGHWGVVANWTAEGNLWSANVWADGPEMGERVTP
ncbi:hypothetical protein [Nocardioides donggukensis]|uniref:Right handed beta helix domain-containing protein n=1 Tax=Nocardioides donggukensis TaxID=2774019 RepID=A0A927Q1T3_9ACTN|nr:hypothetical protein [Nocardioides donggukensis]MBD8870482.1 hypothetical protein [Nocardioides donggukensis]